MVIYIDVLIFVNILVTFFILLLCIKINKIEYKKIFLVLGSLVGGATSLLIFLPTYNLIIEFIIKLLVAFLCIFTSFGYKKLKIFIRNVFTFYVSTFVYAGCMYFVWGISKSNFIYINNSVVYYDISVLYIIVFSLAFYLIFSFISFFVKREAINAKRATAVIYYKDKSQKLMAIFDTGNSVVDIFGNSVVIIASKNIFENLFDKNFNLKDKSYEKRYRILPCKTVSGKQLLEGIRLDKMLMYFENKSYSFQNPILVLSKEEFADDFDAMLNPEILLYS